MGRLEGKRTFVTGGASGLGEAIARRFVAEGAEVVIADIDEATGKSLAAGLGARSRFVSLDVSNEAAWQAALDTCDAIAARVFGDPRRVDLVHRYNPGLGPSPHHLKEGQVDVGEPSLIEFISAPKK